MGVDVCGIITINGIIVVDASHNIKRYAQRFRRVIDTPGPTG